MDWAALAFGIEFKELLIRHVSCPAIPAAACHLPVWALACPETMSLSDRTPDCPRAALEDQAL
jgi:hypothetical protein